MSRWKKCSGLSVITTRTPVADIADYERTSALRRDLDQLSSDAGAKLLQVLGVKGDEAELRSASDEFHGHCLALTLLGSYLADAYNGDVSRRGEVSARLAHDVRHGVHARKVMESYQAWLGVGPEMAVLRMLGLFDRPADEQTFGVRLKSPAIPGLTESLTDLHPTEWQTILAKLRRARLLAGEDPHNPEGIPWIEQKIRDVRATGTVLGLPSYLALKAEALHLGGRTSEALEALNEGETLAERFEQRVYFSRLHRFRGVGSP